LKNKIEVVTFSVIPAKLLLRKQVAGIQSKKLEGRGYEI